MSRTTSPTPQPKATVKKVVVKKVVAKKVAVKRPAPQAVKPVAAAPAKAEQAAKPVKAPKVAKPAAAPKPAKAPKAPKAAKPAKVAKAPKVVRDSFTMPQSDFDIIDRIKLRAIEWKQPVKKSEVLRAALHALEALSDAKVRALLTGLAPIKKGRPKAD
ncbi:hypothetical protein [Aquabacterium parvum]|uniref:hypothetical protein n=1 Tax=Aquabacterium parvum TaxID=70584 RepID=UPI0009FA5EA6|nr:hypothetical protein [Aquabacterium parvum]MBU0914937.1 hypothetical protein [Gammaproteobacteria bacterium]